MIQPCNTRQLQKGFTLIELMLSMTFVSVLLLTIALTVIQIGTIYNRGITLKEVNQVSRDIADDLRRTVQASGPFEVSPTGANTSDTVLVKNGGGVVVGGRLCTGVTSYIWNTAKADSSTRAHFTANPEGSVLGDAVSFVKVPDVGKRYCARTSGDVLAQRHLLYTDTAQAIELLKSGDRTIRMLEFKIATTDSAYDALSSQRLYRVSYRLGAGNTSAMDTAHTQCLPPGDPNADTAFCTIQQFSIVLRAGNTVN